MTTRTILLRSGLAFVLTAWIWTTAAVAGDPEGKPAWTLKAKNKLENFQEVMNNSLIYTRGDDYITVIDPSAGAVKWEKKIEGFKEKAFRILWNDNMYIYGTKKEMVAVNLADGTEKYRLTLNKDVDPTDYVDYINTNNGVLINYKDNVGFYDLTNGKELWVRKDKNMVAANYVVFKNGNFLAFYGKNVAMIDYTTGADIWTRPDKGFSPSDYHQLGNGNFLVFYDKDVRLIDFATGKDLFAAGEESYKDLKYQWIWEPGNPDTPILLFLKNKTTLIGGKDGKVLWTAAARGSKDRGGVKEDKTCSEFVGHALVVYLEKSIVGVNWTDGKETWKEDVKDKDDVADAVVFTITDENNQPKAGLISFAGTLLKFDAATAEKSWKNPDGAIPTDIFRSSQDQGTLGGLKDGVFFGDIVKMPPIEGNDYMVVSYRLKLLSRSSGMHFYRVDLNTGKVKWHRHEPYISIGAIFGMKLENLLGAHLHGPFIYPDLNGFYICTSQGVQWFNLSDGQQVWYIKEYNFVLSMSYFSKPLEVSGESGYFGSKSIAAQWRHQMSMASINLNHEPIIDNGVVYTQGKEKIWAIDLKTGKELWKTGINGDVVQLPNEKRLHIDNGVLYAKTGYYLDENIVNGTRLEKPVVFYNKGDFGFIALDVRTGKVLWKYQDYDGNDPEYLYGVKITKDQLEKGKDSDCALKKLKVGTIYNIFERENYRMFVGQDGLAGVAAGSDNPCKSSWRIKGNIKNVMDIEDLKSGKSVGVFFINNLKKFVVNMDKDLYCFDEAGQKVLWKAGVGGSTKLSTTSGFVYDVDGKQLNAYKLTN